VKSVDTNNQLESSPSRSNWNGSWVWVEDIAADRNVYAQFRRTFSIKQPGQLTLAITANSNYSLYSDGVFIGRGPARAPLAYYQYDEYEIALKPGTHCIAVLVHHDGEINGYMMLGRPGLLVDAHLESAGATVDLSTGKEWKCQKSTAWRRDLPERMSHFGFWEECTLAQLPVGWTKPMFDDGKWQKPVVVGKPPCNPWERLMPRDIPLPKYTNIPVHQVVAQGTWEDKDAENPVPSKQASARKRTLQSGIPALPFVSSSGGKQRGAYLTVDFGRTISGYVEIELAERSTEARLDISYDEMLTPDKAVNPERSYAHLTDRYFVAAGHSIIRPVHPRGFRFVTIDVCGTGEARIARVSAIEEVYPFEYKQTLVISDNDLMSFYGKGAQTVQACTTDCFTDCPTRERVQWMEDLYMHSKVAEYVFADTAMLRRTLFQAAQCVMADGRINGFFPTERTNLGVASASISWLHLLTDYWLFAGNDDVRQLLPFAKQLLELFDTQCDKEWLLVKWPGGQFWEWAPIESEGCLLLTNAAFVWALERLSEHQVFSEVLGKNIKERIAQIRKAAHARFWDAKRKLYTDTVPVEGKSTIYSQDANTMAILAGICPQAERVSLLKRIIHPDNLGPIPVGEDSLNDKNRATDGRLVPAGTLWFAHFLCQALFENGCDKEGIEQMKMFWGQHKDLPNCPETRIQRGNTGLSHGWGRGPAYLLPAFVLGVRPTNAGWSEVTVHPHPASLTSAKGTFITPRGQLTVEWSRTKDGLSIQLAVPPKMTVRLTGQQGEEQKVTTTQWHGELPWKGDL